MKLLRKNLLHREILILTLGFFWTLGYMDLVFSSQENYFEEMELNNVTKDGFESEKSIPTNPFEIVDMLRKANSMNDATIPSDAIDDAIKSFNDIKVKQ